MTSSTPGPLRRSSASPSMVFGSSPGAVPSPQSDPPGVGYSSPATSLLEPNAAPAERVTIPGVELARVGSFNASTGPATLVAEDFASAVAALAAGVTGRPILKLGHRDPRFDGEPSVGWIDRLYLSQDGTRLVGDLAGVPRWLADAMGTSWPNRSIEGRWNYSDADGRVWRFVLDGLALLGAEPPAIGGLADLRDFVAASAGQPRSSATIAAKARRIRRARNMN